MHGDDRASLGVRQGVMAMLHGKPEMRRHGMQFMILQVGKVLLGADMRAIERVIRVRDLVQFVQGPQHMLVEEHAMRHEGQALHLIDHLSP